MSKLIMTKSILNIFYFGLVSMLYYISYHMYQTNTVDIGLNYKSQLVVVNWAYVFLIATTFAVVGLYVSGLNEYFPFINSHGRDDVRQKPVRLTRAERREKERQDAKS